MIKVMIIHNTMQVETQLFIDVKDRESHMTKENKILKCGESVECEINENRLIIIKEEKCTP